MPVFTASDGSRHNTTSQAKAEQLSKKLRNETAGRSDEPNIGLESTFFDASGAPDPKGTKVETFKGDTKTSETYKPYVPYVEPSVDARDAGQYIKGAGLQGLLKDSDLVGLTRSEAQKRVSQAQARAKGSTSALTSYSFNPATISGAKKTYEGFNAKLQDTQNDPWTSKGTKKDKMAGLYESTAAEFAKLFDSPESFDSALTSNADLAAGMEAFKRAGGDLNSIRSRIGANMTQQQQTDTQLAAIQGIVDQGITDPEEIAAAMNEAGRASGQNSGFTGSEVMRLMSGSSEQSTADYLAGLADPLDLGTPAEAEAFKSLIPERELAQDQIMRLANVPQQYKDLYFGTPEQMGVLQEKRIQAEEQKKILERREKSDERNLRAVANLTIEKNNADLAIEEAQIEENRLAARNYATGQLAKLGALNTTGAATVKLATIEQKYQQQAQQMRSATRFANQRIELKLKDDVSNVEIDTDEKILDLQGDLTKDREEVLKEVQKLEASAWDKIYSISDKAAGELRTQKEKYVKEAKTLAEKAAKAAAKASESYDVNGWGGTITGGTEAERKLKRIAQYQEVFTPGIEIEEGSGVYTVDENGFITPEAWREGLKEAPTMGLSKKEFIENFASMLYIDEDGMPDKSYGLTAKELSYLEG